MNKVLVICVITTSSALSDGAGRAIVGLCGPGCELAFAPDIAEPTAAGRAHPSHDLVLSRARAFLARQMPPVRLGLIIAPSFDGALQQLTAAGQADLCVGLVLLSAPTLAASPPDPNGIAASLDAFWQRIESSGIATMRSLRSDIVFVRPDDYQANPYLNTLLFRLRVLPAEDWGLQAEITLCLLSYLQFIYTNRLSARRLRQPERAIPLADQLGDFLCDRQGAHWGLYYYTGSVISSLIKRVETLARQRGVACIRGPNEHSLACGAFINWRLYRQSYLIVVTSAMLDEFKGTLANLQRAGARGLIVCADARTNKWYGFQATINTEGDIRRVLDARGIPYVYMEDPQTLADDLEQVFRLYDATDGPVVVIATQQVLESTAPIARQPVVPPRPTISPTVIDAGRQDRLASAMRIINDEKAHILWQCGAIDAAERDLILDLSERAGIALADGLTAPGFLPAYRDGRRVPNYLGPLGQYGSSKQVFDFLQTDGRLNDRDSQCLFFLKSKIGQMDSPFSDATHHGKLRIVQVNKDRRHIAPFCNIALDLPLLDVLRYFRDNLAPRPDVLEFRAGRLVRVRESRQDASGVVPTLPMTPNYFFSRLRDLLDRMITQQGYRYIGLFDVGHCGTLGVHYLPRTDPGYSGWYGRGLMGDALQACGCLAFTAAHNIILIAGDGARHITPDIVPNMLENLQSSSRTIRRNVTIFFLVNNALSIINTYQRGTTLKSGGRQMNIVNHVDFMQLGQRSTTVDGVTFLRDELLAFDAARIETALCAPAQVNLFQVPLTDNDDALSYLIDAQNWQYPADQ